MPNKKTVKANSDSSSYYRKLSKSQLDSAESMAVKNNPLWRGPMERGIKNQKKAIMLERKSNAAKKK